MVDMPEEEFEMTEDEFDEAMKQGEPVELIVTAPIRRQTDLYSLVITQGIPPLAEHGMSSTLANVNSELVTT